MSTATSPKVHPSHSTHPLQCLSSPSLLGFSALLHLLGLASFAYSFNYLSAFPTPINDSYGWHFQYLTILGLAFCTFTFASALLADLTSSPFLFKLKNYLSMYSAPLAVLIPVLYWPLRIYDRNLVIPPSVQLPFPADLSFHAVPGIVMTLDLLVLSPPWTISPAGAMAFSTIFAFGYWFWVEQCFQHNGFYPYPIFEFVGTAGRVGLFLLSAAIMTGSTVALKGLYTQVNGIEEAERE